MNHSHGHEGTFKRVRTIPSTLAALGLALAATSAHSDTSSALIESGWIQGVTEDGVYIYKGIPFAAPPVGNMRWRPPQPVPAWRDVYKAHSFKPQCMQLGPPLPTMPAEPTSEDCLYLNVWAPAQAQRSKRAVMVWIHGGQFRRGSPSTPLYWGDELARNNDVIVINISYRVGPLGFLAHPDLTAESVHHSSGNYGLMDVIAALRWVRRNAAAFGGDTDRITVFGQSAGAWIINKLMISPLARDLFHAAIAQSGGDMGPMRTEEGLAVLTDAERSGVAFATEFGVRSIAQLREVGADKLVASTFDGVPGIPHSNAALPIVDGYVIPADTFSLYDRGKQADIPLLLGYNAAEGAYIAPRTNPETFIADARRHYGQFADRILQLLPTDSPSTSEAQERLWAESAFGWQMWAWARSHAKTSSGKVFFYYFRGKRNGHGAELPFVFGHPFIHPWDDDDRKTAQIISGYWSTFAKTGDPNAAPLPLWPPYTSRRQSVMHLGEKMSVGDMPDTPLHELFDTYMNSLRTRTAPLELK